MKIDSNLIIKECVKCTGDLKYHYISKFDDNEKNDQNQIIPAPIKPQRARHCHICDRCCMLMDHHCFWIGNHLIKGIWSTFKIFENWQLILSVGITAFTWYNFIFLILINLFMHLYMGNTLIEIKYIYRHKWTNPYKCSIF